MNLGKALQALKFDNRMKDWNISQGTATKEELDAHDNGLQDLSDKCAPMDLEAGRGRSAIQEDPHSLQ